MSRATEHKNKIREENAKAQAQTLVLDLAQITQLLSEKSQILDSTQKRIESLLILEKTLTDKVEQLIATVNSVQRNTQVAKEHLEHSKQDLYKQEKDFDADHIRKTKINEDVLRTQARHIEQNTTTLETQRNQIVQSNIQVKRLDEELVILKTEAAEVNKSLRSANAQLNKLIEEYETKKISINKDIKDKKDEFDEIELHVIEEKEKIAKPLTALKMEEERMAVIRRDLDIYNARVTARFKYMFPDKVMNI